MSEAIMSENKDGNAAFERMASAFERIAVAMESQRQSDGVEATTSDKEILLELLEHCRTQIGAKQRLGKHPNRTTDEGRGNQRALLKWTRFANALSRVVGETHN